MKVNFLKQSFLMGAYSINSPLQQITSGKVKMINDGGPTLILVEKFKKKPSDNPSLTEYEVI
jgi:hypothetical protein